jgi:hypothetical protein
MAKQGTNTPINIFDDNNYSISDVKKLKITPVIINDIDKNITAMEKKTFSCKVSCQGLCDTNCSGCTSSCGTSCTKSCGA